MNVKNLTAAVAAALCLGNAFAAEVAVPDFANAVEPSAATAVRISSSGAYTQASDAGHDDAANLGLNFGNSFEPSAVTAAERVNGVQGQVSAPVQQVSRASTAIDFPG